MSWPCWRNVYHAHDARGFDVDLVPRTDTKLLDLCWLLQVVNRRAGPLDKSGTSRVGVGVPTRTGCIRVWSLCLCVGCCCWCSPPRCLSFSDAWFDAAAVGRLQGNLAGVPLPRKIDRHRARAAKLAVSLSFALRCSQSGSFVCSALPAADAHAAPWAPPPLTRPISNLPKHLLSSHTPFAWSPAPTRVFDDWAILPRSCSYKSFQPCFIPTVLLFLSFFPRKTKPPNDRPTDRRPNPARICLQEGP